MNDQTSLLIIQTLLAVIVIILGWSAFMIKGWVADLKIEQRDQWSRINQNRSDIDRMQGPSYAND